jgi:PAS domain S-box-containing protein
LQILDLLLSTFENAYHKNLELNETQKQLTRLNEQLEQRVEERTIKLKAEVAKRMQAEEVLKESERYTRGLFEVNLDPLVTISAKGKITDVNHATEVVTGMFSKEIIGTDFSNYFTSPDSARKGYKQVFRKGFVRNYPLEIKHHDGKVTPVLFNASVYKDMEGRIAGCFAAARDITKIKQAEEELKKYQDHLEELVKERTAELEKKNKELKRFNKLFVGREFRIKELKNKVKELEDKIKYLERENE